LSGIVQIIRGVVATPQSMVAPSQGKWWNEQEGKWVKTNMEDDVKTYLDNVPEDDSDILGDLENDAEQKASGDGTTKGDVKDMFYYDTLEVAPDAEAGAIRRKYYVLARKYHPDKNKGDQAAAEKFKDIAEAYQVLSDPELRKKYNAEGRDGLSADKTSVADGGMPKIDPSVLFAFLFGSDQFHDYVGRLATATSASIGDSPKVSIPDARKLQKRRTLRLAQKLITKISPWCAAGDATATIEDDWKKEATELSKASYGYQLVSTLGMVRTHNKIGIVVVSCKSFVIRHVYRI